MNKIVVIGQGYVGLPLAIAAYEAGYEVTGIDNSVEKVALLKSGITGIEDLSNSKLKEALSSGRYIATNQVDVIKESDVILVCVPTPLTNDHKPDLTYLLNAIESVAHNLKQGALIIIESTVEPGTTRSIVLPMIEKISGLSSDKFLLAFSPERHTPGVADRPRKRLRRTS
jgi:nucleotide sugar dehydrogenase